MLWRMLQGLWQTHLESVSWFAAFAEASKIKHAGFCWGYVMGRRQRVKGKGSIHSIITNQEGDHASQTKCRLIVSKVDESWNELTYIEYIWVHYSKATFGYVIGTECLSQLWGGPARLPPYLHLNRAVENNHFFKNQHQCFPSFFCENIMIFQWFSRTWGVSLYQTYSF
jgi:hypothetical protein